MGIRSLWTVLSSTSSVTATDQPAKPSPSSGSLRHALFLRHFSQHLSAREEDSAAPVSASRVPAHPSLDGAPLLRGAGAAPPHPGRAQPRPAAKKRRGSGCQRSASPSLPLFPRGSRPCSMPGTSPSPAPGRSRSPPCKQRGCLTPLGPAPRAPGPCRHVCPDAPTQRLPHPAPAPAPACTRALLHPPHPAPFPLLHPGTLRPTTPTPLSTLHPLHPSILPPAAPTHPPSISPLRPSPPAPFPLAAARLHPPHLAPFPLLHPPHPAPSTLLHSPPGAAAAAPAPPGAAARLGLVAQRAEGGGASAGPAPFRAARPASLGGGESKTERQLTRPIGARGRGQRHLPLLLAGGGAELSRPRPLSAL